MSKEIQVNNTKVYINGEGKETIFMIHGWPDTHKVWDKQVDFFKNDFRCVTFTLPGFVRGDKKKYTLEHIIAEIDAIIHAICPNEKVILMVHDWGCIFGYEFAMRNPDKIAKMVGIDIGDANSGDFIKSLSLSAKLMVFAYQMTLAFGYILRWNALHKIMAKALKAPGNQAYVHSGMGLPYAMKWLGVNGGMRKMKQMIPTFPFYYAYGTRKPFLFHSKNWENKIKTDPANKVKPFASNHWVMVDKAEAFNVSVNEWLMQ